MLFGYFFHLNMDFRLFLFIRSVLKGFDHEFGYAGAIFFFKAACRDGRSAEPRNCEAGCRAPRRPRRRWRTSPMDVDHSRSIE